MQKSAGVVVFRRENKKTHYLFLLSPSISRKNEYFFDLPKGHIEEGEKEIDTAKRELEEETGISEADFFPEFKKWIKYFFKLDGKNIFKIAVFFLAQTKKKEITLSSEHVDYEWFTLDEAMKNLSFENTKEVLREADQFIRENKSSLPER